MAYWLMKSEPDAFSLDALKAAPKKTTIWDGVRNYQARNWMREMAKGDGIFYYHSNTDVPGIVGLAKISGTAHPDPTQFDPNDSHYDPSSKHDDPRWDVVDVTYVRHLKRAISLSELREHHGPLGDFPLLRKANRLSVMPVTDEQWAYILALEPSRGTAPASRTR